MKGSPASHMTVGILQAAAFPESVQSSERSLAAFQQIAADGFFGAVELTMLGRGAARCSASALIKESGLVADVDAGAALYRSGASLCSLDPTTRARALGLVQEAIDDAYALGASRLSIVSGRDPGQRDRAVATNMLVDAIGALYEYAGARGGLELSLKMADRAVDICFLIGPTLDGIVVAQRVRERHPDFGLVLNLGHLPLLDENIETAVRLSAPFLARVHLGNCIVASGDSHPRFGVPGGAIGVAEVARCLRTLSSVGYLSASGNNVVAFEIRPTLDEDPVEVIADSKRVLCEAWAHA